MLWRRRILVGFGLLPALILGACGEVPGELISPAETPPAGDAGNLEGVPEDAQEVRVARVVDGDTIWVAVDNTGGPIPPGDRHRVRILQIDSPEMPREDAPGECGAPEATAFAAAQLPVGSTVYIQADREDKDQYGRYLRYVWSAGGKFFNEQAVEQGYARAVLFQPNDRHIGLIRQAEARAKQQGRGVWGALCAGVG